MQRQVFCLLVTLVAGACAMGSSLAGGGKLTSGDDAEPGQFPYQVSIQWDGPLGRSHICGGAILKEDWIVTAAHCVMDPLSIGHFVIVAGEVNLKVVEGGEQEVGVKYIYPSPNYPIPAGVSEDNDIALVRLRESLVFNENVSAISLPRAGVVPTGAALLSGWGVSGGLILPTHPDVLQYSAVTIESGAECLARFPDAPLFGTNFCSRGRVATCDGDDGTPLAWTRPDGSNELVGIVASSTKPCGDAGQPSIYTQVSSHVGFIECLIKL